MTHPITHLSPLDGRYRQHIEGLQPILSEKGLIHARVEVEIEWLLHLSQIHLPELEAFSDTQTKALRNLYLNFDDEAALAIKAIEATTNHDVKAVEYWLKQALVTLDLQHAQEFVHFACTSEDINNLSHGLMIKKAQKEVMLPTLQALLKAVAELAQQHGAQPMLSRTHGQTASPTTLGKEIAVFAYRLDRQITTIKNQPILGKMNGAVGNYNAHMSAYPGLDWVQISHNFIENLGLTPNPYTTQIESHDWIAELFQSLSRFNQITLDFCRDMWGYIAWGYFTQKIQANEVGSSTMPHKVNPIDFENAEGNLGLSNAVMQHMADKLMVSRWQRDLSDSTVLRNMGVGLGYGLIAYKACLKGIGKLQVNSEVLNRDLDQAYEVLAEPIQTVMRRFGLENPYEQLKAFTRGKAITKDAIQQFVATLKIPQSAKQSLLDMTPSTYLGNAVAQAQQLPSKLNNLS